MNYVKTYFLDIVTKHFFDFKGKETRKVYWLFYLNCIILYFILGLISGTLSTIAGLILLLPALGILVRRLRDAGFSPWWALLALTGIGSIVLLIMACFPSK